MDPYEVLGVSPGASPEEIKTAYRTLVKRYHPDKYPDAVMKARAEERIKEINEAYDMLTKGSSSDASSNADRGYSGSYSGDFAAEFSKIEMLINRGRIEEAAAMLAAIPLHNARWHYLKGIIETQEGRYSAAAREFEQSYRMEPNNPEYKAAYEQTHMNGQGYQHRYSTGDSSYGDDSCGFCSSCCQAVMCSYCMSAMCNGCMRGCC